MILAGDIGGTKTELALFEDIETRKIIKKSHFSSKAYASLEDIVLEFLSSCSYVPTSACFGVAGPIENNTCYTTNLPWI
ncbi:MAG: glucokinase, partial [Verrucomicrobia bacterium]|nr:glucokinase [Verrucomicrobiota bacterium]